MKLSIKIGILKIICESFGWNINRIRQYKRAVEINDEMNIFLEEIKIQLR
jgi:hypothetical protein